MGSRFLEVLAHGFSGKGPAQPGRRIRCLILEGLNTEPVTRVCPRVELVEGDLRVSECLPAAVEGVDVIFHIAGVVHARRIHDFYEINAQGTRNLLTAAVKANVNRFIYISSNSAAGYTRDGSLMRESDPPRPYMSYGRSKHMAEQAVKEFAEKDKLEAVVLRPCWYYGPRQPESEVKPLGQYGQAKI